MPVKPQIIGLYGLPGSGKSFILQQLKQEMDGGNFSFFEGSELIDKLTPGGLEAFKRLPYDEKYFIREKAIKDLRQVCAGLMSVNVIVGHYMFWDEGETEPARVLTGEDLSSFTHIFYLETPAEVVQDRRNTDLGRSRPSFSTDHLQRWQDIEISELRKLCRQHHILFAALPQHPLISNTVRLILEDVHIRTEERNAHLLLEEIRVIVEGPGPDPRFRNALVFDGDRTLAPVDTGTLFWKSLATTGYTKARQSLTCPLHDLFSSPLSYSYPAFRQASFLYGEMDQGKFEAACEDVASQVEAYPELLSIIQASEQHPDTKIIVVTCGLRLVWEKVLRRMGLHNSVNVIGAGQPWDAESFVITAELKGRVVDELQCVHGLRVSAFGDSPLDLPMLARASHATIIVGEESTRSKTMDAALAQAVWKDGLKAQQLLLPGTVPPRCDVESCPVVTTSIIMNQIFGEDIKRADKTPSPGSTHTTNKFEFVHATDSSAAKMLMSPMRDAGVSGPALREAHRQVGRYLALEFVSKMVGLEQYPIPHVQGHTVTGSRLLHEDKTLIVPLMRGGEPMALGLNDVFPRAGFRHATEPEDLKLEHLDSSRTIILVDSVINSGKSIREFVEHIVSVKEEVRIVVVAGVVQSESLFSGGYALERSALRLRRPYGRLGLVALRVSENKFTGHGTTDTGNRLFNTTHLA